MTVSQTGQASDATTGTVVEQIAQQVFGYDGLRAGQADVLSSVLNDQDTLAIMPTGSGKSAIYQIAGLRLPGITLVVSPLIALQQDQVESIAAQKTVKAALLNSTLTRTQREDVFEQLESGEIEFLFLAPEQLSNEETLDRIKALAPSLFVVDEAHCVSEWGHDFRPEYLQLAPAIESLGHPVVLALTATASPLVRKEIVEQLGMNNPVELVKGFDRPNIHLSAFRFYEEAQKREKLIAAVQTAEKPGIVYVATRKAAESIAAELVAEGVSAKAYHAGMKASDRTQVQTQFMDDAIEVIVATTAFGMGIDKTNVRFVYHYHVPGSLDAYYQEIGRAARDRQPATAALFFLADDLKLQRFLSGGTQVDADTLSEIADFLDAVEHAPTESQLKHHFALTRPKLSAALDALEAAGMIERGKEGEICEVTEDADLDRTVDMALSFQARRKQFGRSRLEMMRGYAQTDGCLRQYVLSYFGEAFEPPCDGCDRCDQLKATEPEKNTIVYPQPFPPGSTIIHTQFGKGQVLRYEDDTVSVLFETVGYKSFVTKMIEHSVTCLDV